jgi:predicted metalloprotease
VREYFTRELTDEELTAGGAYSAVIATVHDYAHHVQNMIGSIATYQNQAGSDAKGISRRIELEADCLTGWVSGYLNKTGAHVPSTLDNWAAATTLTEIGDDFIDPSLGAQGHGTIEQRVAAWQEGLLAGITLAEPYAACIDITDQVLAGTTGGQRVQ